MIYFKFTKDQNGQKESKLRKGGLEQCRLGRCRETWNKSKTSSKCTILILFYSLRIYQVIFIACLKEDKRKCEIQILRTSLKVVNLFLPSWYINSLWANILNNEISHHMYVKIQISYGSLLISVQTVVVKNVGLIHLSDDEVTKLRKIISKWRGIMNWLSQHEMHCWSLRLRVHSNLISS